MKIAVVGLGYVGLPLSLQFAKSGVEVVGLDIDSAKVNSLNRGRSYIHHIRGSEIKAQLGTGRFSASTDFGMVRKADAVIICVPTPLNKNREPDISYIIRTGEAIAPHLHNGILVVLESTTYPGTTDEDLRRVLESGSGLKAGKGFHLAFSPEREDPGNPDSKVALIPKVVGGYTAACRDRAVALYSQAIKTIVPVSSCRAAEATKLLENIFRGVNIALVNELKQVYSAMGIDIWEVINAAKTKPFGYMPFYPGPGLGGHCIPIDPFYLTWKAREFDFSTRFIELAGEVNNNMPYFCRSLISQALNHGANKSVSGAKILIVGVAYKPDIGDWRETPAEKLIHLLRNAGADVSYHDPFVPEFDGMTSSPLEPEQYDCIAIVTNHSSIDYADLVRRGKVIVDFRNATKGHEVDGKVWKL